MKFRDASTATSGCPPGFRFPSRRVLIWSAIFCFALISTADASFHLMQIEQVIGGVNGDTSAQAVQLRMRFTGENFVSGGKLIAFDAAGNNPITLITFPSNVSNGAAGSRILITTASFASHEISPISSDFQMASAIPGSYLAAGRLVYQNGGILWSVSWGGSAYMGSNNGTLDNDADGNFGPPFAAPLPSGSTTALQFKNGSSAQSTNNAADYALTAAAATFTNNSGTSAALAAATPTPTPTPAPTPILPRIAGGPIRVELQPIATGLTAPNDLVPANDGSDRLFIVEQPGQILLVKNGQLSATPFLDLSDRLVPLNPRYDERGLLGLAFHPGFNDPASAGFQKLYTYTSEPVAGPADFTVPLPADKSFNHQSVIAEWQIAAANPDVVDPASRRELMRIDEPQFNHNGGKLAFRPADKYLYLGLGDGGAANDVGDGHTSPGGNAQDLTNVLGKILRIDPVDPKLTSGSADPASANGKYRVPASNPFVASASPIARVVEIYAYGLRNPFRFNFDVPTDKFIVADVGQNNVEEIDLIESGKNYGWNRKEGTFLFNPNDGTVSPDPYPDAALTDPIAEYSHADGKAVIGGFVSHGNAVPALAGKYVFGDLSAVAQEGEGGAPTGRLFYLDGLPSSTIRGLGIGLVDRPLGLFLKGFGQDAKGDVYMLADSNIGPSGAGGQVLKIVSVPAAPAVINLSTRLKVETGDSVLIGGFFLNGSSSKKVMLRGIGPSLALNGQPIPGRLGDPVLTLFDGDGKALASNDDWINGGQEQQIRESGIPPSDSKESAIIANLAPGRYTINLSGVEGASGIGLVELYDLEQTQPANFANISTRGFVQTDDNVVIGGFFIGGSASQRILVRAIGPSLASAGVIRALQDPTLELHDANGGLLASNDNWKATQQSEISATGIPPSDDRESAIVATLAPAGYTAIVRGANNTTGIALVEAYQLSR